MKFTGYMAWILLCKYCKFGEKFYYNSCDIEFFLGDYFFWRALYLLICLLTYKHIKHVSLQSSSSSASFGVDKGCELLLLLFGVVVDDWASSPDGADLFTVICLSDCLSSLRTSRFQWRRIQYSRRVCYDLIRGYRTAVFISARISSPSVDNCSRRSSWG